ncbi:unnamed protein product [Candidula unifasciata]|uniref:Uncharacterized protein n=1 Tax=Candidula unifasciata TaxID=100452 RepID=A0A8S3Z384_9EUPU|nr:unnamed protein product [Candidula unifasciata]
MTVITRRVKAHYQEIAKQSVRIVILPLKENLINNHQQPQSEGTLSENCDEVNKQQDMLLEDDKGSAHEQLTKSYSRAEYLTDLLKMTRVCLLSGKCLMKTMNKANVRTSKAAQAILQNALEYILRKDSLHVFCPASAVHRPISHLENVIVAVTTDNSTNVLVCRRQRRWYGLGNRFREWIYCPLITCFNNDVYLRAQNKSIHVYETSRNTWRAILDSPDQENTCLLTIGHFLYAVRPTSECYSLEIINILDPRQWVKVSSLPSDLGSIDCSAVIGDNILFFGSIAGKSEAQVFVFDTTTFRCVPLNGIRPLSSSKVFSVMEETALCCNRMELFIEYKLVLMNLSCKSFMKLCFGILTEILKVHFWSMMNSGYLDQVSQQMTLMPAGSCLFLVSLNVSRTLFAATGIQTICTLSCPQSICQRKVLHFRRHLVYWV